MKKCYKTVIYREKGARIYSKDLSKWYNNSQTISQIKQVRLVPRLNHYVIEVIYEATEKQYELEKNRVASIDVGLNNLATLTFNQAGIKPKSDQWQTVKIYQSIL
ncbi:hypothetical protein [Okeania sp. SIO2C9]|uniref:hypothetical protein n=1 Tax=Okeania sp. SIO2C9 TaxID=2607791 RepID=UPI0025FDA8CB|nr:hypothetical protein [Okeania sp. SIO2C9]